MLQVALLRNVNQGQAGHPSTSDIRDAFAVAGCPDAVTFQSNGTVVFESDDPDAVVETVIATLAARVGGNGTRIAERLTGTPASSRGLPTLIRLVRRFAPKMQPDSVLRPARQQRDGPHATPTPQEPKARPGSPRTCR